MKKWLACLILLMTLSLSAQETTENLMSAIPENEIKTDNTRAGYVTAVGLIENYRIYSSGMIIVSGSNFNFGTSGVEYGFSIPYNHPQKEFFLKLIIDAMQNNKYVYAIAYLTSVYQMPEISLYNQSCVLRRYDF